MLIMFTQRYMVGKVIKSIVPESIFVWFGKRIYIGASILLGDYRYILFI
jgi:hypothetical protein